jgi:hypothetical protein
MVISSPIFEAYLKCPSKCWFLFLGEKGDANIYENLKLEYPVLWTGMKSFPAEGRDKCAMYCT